MNKYNSYEETGVEWIGEIPRHWLIKKIGYISKLLTGNPWKSDLFNFDNGIKIVRGENVSEGFLRWGSKSRYWIDEVSDDSIFYLNDGDIIIGMDGSKVGKNYVRLKHVDLPLLLHQRMCRIRVNQDYSPNFIEYWVGSEMFRFYIDISKTDPMIPHITQKNISDFQIPFPPLSEQSQIVQFLDEKTSLIDSLIEKTKRKIELLKEERTSLINHTVTKGLNPNVEMKDSDEKWIGSFPKHWEHIHFGVICSLQQGLQIPFENRFFDKTEDSYEYITTQSIHRPEQQRQYIKSPKKSVLCTKDDIIYGRTGNTGEVVTNVEGVFHNNFFRIDYNKDKLLKNYLVWFLNNTRFKEHILLLSGTTTIPDLNHSSFFSNRVLIPSIEEQKEIVQFLDEKTSIIDKTIELEGKRIELLKEYRQSIISEVVTGKIKVTTDE